MKVYRRFSRQTIKEAAAEAYLSSSTWGRIETGQLENVTARQFIALSASLWVIIQIGMSDHVGNETENGKE